MQWKFAALLLAAALWPLDGGGTQITATATVLPRTAARNCSVEVAAAKAGSAQGTREGTGLFFSAACPRAPSAAPAVHDAAFYNLVAERSASVPQVARPGIDGARPLVVEIMY